MDDSRQTSLTAGEGVIVLDRAFRVMGCSRAARQILGEHLQVGEPFLLDNLLQGPHLAEAHAALDATLASGEPHNWLKARAVDQQGQDFSCILSFDPLFGRANRVIGVIIVFRDEYFVPIEAAPSDPSDDNLVDVPALGYPTLFEHLAEGVFTINTRWRIMSFNQVAERITGYRREEVLGRHCWDIFRSDLCDSGCPLRATLENGVTRMDQDVRILDKGGERLGILVNTSVVRDRGRQVVGAVETFRPLAGWDSPLEPNNSRHSFSDIIGDSPALRRIFQMLPDLAASEASVLIQGESGTGKELFARAIHHHSPRSKGPFVAVNCSALAETLLESEMFGHEKAAFTGAVRSKVGRFEMAKGGTLFLDEIGDLKPELQVKLLRVLEQRVFERVGGTRLIPMEARIISATHEDLRAGLKAGTFREDLFYRLRTVPLQLPPLRERREDIPLLVHHFMAKLNQKYGKEVRALDSKVIDFFQKYHWPGNVRELERIMEHAYVFVKGPMIFLHNLPDLEGLLEQSGPEPAEGTDGPADSSQEQERRRIEQALAQAGGRRAEAARLLGLSRTSLWRRMKALGLS